MLYNQYKKSKVCGTPWYESVLSENLSRFTNLCPKFDLIGNYSNLKWFSDRFYTTSSLSLGDHGTCMFYLLFGGNQFLCCATAVQIVCWIPMQVSSTANLSRWYLSKHFGPSSASKCRSQLDRKTRTISKFLHEITTQWTSYSKHGIPCILSFVSLNTPPCWRHFLEMWGTIDCILSMFSN